MLTVLSYFPLPEADALHRPFFFLPLLIPTVVTPRRTFFFIPVSTICSLLFPLAVFFLVLFIIIFLYGSAFGKDGRDGLMHGWRTMTRGGRGTKVAPSFVPPPFFFTVFSFLSLDRVMSVATLKERFELPELESDQDNERSMAGNTTSIHCLSFSFSLHDRDGGGDAALDAYSTCGVYTHICELSH